MAYAGMILRAAYASRRIGHDPTARLKAKRARADEGGGQVGPEQVPTRAEEPALRAAGLAGDRFVFHACRHLCASTLLAEGAPSQRWPATWGTPVETVMRTNVHWLPDDPGGPGGGARPGARATRRATAA